MSKNIKRNIFAVASLVSALSLTVAMPVVTFAQPGQATVRKALTAQKTATPKKTTAKKAAVKKTAVEKAVSQTASEPADTADQLIHGGTGDTTKTDQDTKTDHTETMSDEEKNITLDLTEMLQKAGSYNGLQTTYKYTEAHDVQAAALHTGDLVVKDGTDYIYVSFKDAEGKARNQLWAVDEANAVKGKSDLTDAVLPRVYTLTKEPAKYTAPSGLKASAGASLASVALPEGWNWDNGNAVVAEGDAAYDATFTPPNLITETPAKVKLTVTGSKVQEVTPLELPASNYDVAYRNGLTLSAVTLPAGWAFSTPSAALKPGVNTVTVTFTGDKSKTYSAPTDDRTITITASQKNPVISMTSVTVEAGTSLSGSANLPAVAGGKLVWVEAHDKLVPGTYTYAVNFVPDDTGMYAAKNGINITVTVIQNHTGTAVLIKLPDDVYNVSIQKGAKVSDVVVLPEHWAFADKQSILQPGSHQYKVVFTGDKTKNYDHSIADRVITVSATKKRVSFGKISIDVKAGEVLKDSMLPTSTAGRLHFDTPGEAMQKTGTYTVKAHFTPTDPDSTEAMSVTVTVNVTDNTDDKGKDTDKGKFDDKNKATDTDKKNDDKGKSDSDKKTDTDKKSDTGKTDSGKKTDDKDKSDSDKKANDKDKTDSDKKSDDNDKGKDKSDSNKKSDDKKTDTDKKSDSNKKEDTTGDDEKPIDKTDQKDKKDDTGNHSDNKTDDKKNLDDMFVIDFRNKEKTDDNNKGKKKDNIKDIKPDEILPISDEKNKNSPLPDLVITDAEDSTKLKEDHKIADLDVISSKKKTKEKKDTPDEDVNTADTPDEGTSKTKKKAKTEKKKVSVMARAVVGFVFAAVAAGVGALIYFVIGKKKGNE